VCPGSTAYANLRTLATRSVPHVAPHRVVHMIDRPCVRGVHQYSPHTLISVAVQTLSPLVSAARSPLSHIIIAPQDSYRKPAPPQPHMVGQMCKRNGASDVRRPRAGPSSQQLHQCRNNKSNRRVRYGLQYVTQTGQYVVDAHLGCIITLATYCPRHISSPVSIFLSDRPQGAGRQFIRHAAGMFPVGQQMGSIDMTLPLL